jgi:hypothetical protein
VEGPGYWSYGTTFNVLFLDAVEHALGTDFDLTRMPGFLDSADYMLHIIGPSGHLFNYADGGSRPSAQPARHWMAANRNRPELAWNDLALLQAFSREASPSNPHSERLTPFFLLWATEDPEANVPEALHWHAGGEMPVAFHRSDWTPEATYFAIKGGAPSLSHAHMDVGGFVLDMDGVRWALDLGAESYHEIEKRGLNLWSRAQDGDRWTMFRLGSFSHNILTVNGEHQRVTGNAPIVSSEGAPEQRTVVDLSPVYEGQLASAVRSMQLVDKGHVVLTDTVKAPEEKSARIRWAMITKGEPEFQEPGRTLLHRKGKTLEVTLEGPGASAWQVMDARPDRDWEMANEGVRVLFFEAEIPSGGEAVFRVRFRSLPPL